jgi:hypothetical protein
MRRPRARRCRAPQPATPRYPVAVAARGDRGDVAHLVQLRFAGRGWVTVGVGADRVSAAARAGVLYRSLDAPDGEHATGVRVLSEDELRVEGGDRADQAAALQLARGSFDS